MILFDWVASVQHYFHLCWLNTGLITLLTASNIFKLNIRLYNPKLLLYLLKLMSKDGCFNWTHLNPIPNWLKVWAFDPSTGFNKDKVRLNLGVFVGQAIRAEVNDSCAIHWITYRSWWRSDSIISEYLQTQGSEHGEYYRIIPITERYLTLPIIQCFFFI